MSRVIRADQPLLSTQNLRNLIKMSQARALGGKVMNENVWDPVAAWQALLPGSVTECPEKLPEINL